MRIIFVRHGHPNYKNDCLTELGHLHAQAAAERLRGEKIDRIFSSSCGRAAETAQHIADMHGLNVEKLDFMREIAWGSLDENPIAHNGHPWSIAEDMVAAGQTLLSPAWAEEELFARNRVTENALKVGENFDRWLADLGFEREGEFYRVHSNRYSTVMMVSHGGSSSAVMSHLFNLPFPFVCSALCPDFTAITVVSLAGDEGSLAAPSFEIMNDARHIAGLESEKMYGR